MNLQQFNHYLKGQSLHPMYEITLLDVTGPIYRIFTQYHLNSQPENLWFDLKVTTNLRTNFSQLKIVDDDVVHALLNPADDYCYNAINNTTIHHPSSLFDNDQFCSMRIRDYTRYLLAIDNLTYHFQKTISYY